MDGCVDTGQLMQMHTLTRAHCQPPPALSMDVEVEGRARSHSTVQGRCGVGVWVPSFSFMPSLSLSHTPPDFLFSFFFFSFPSSITAALLLFSTQQSFIRSFFLYSSLDPISNPSLVHIPFHMSSNGASTLGMPDSLPKQGTMSDSAGPTLEPRTLASPGPWRPSSIARSSSPALVADNKPWASPSKKALGVSSSISSSSTSSSTFGNNVLHNSSYQNNNRSSTPMGEDYHHNQGSGSSVSKSASPVLTSGSFTRTQGMAVDSSSSPHSSATQAQPQPLNMEALKAKFADSRETKEKYATLQLSPALTPSTFQEKDRRPAPMGSFSTPATNIKVQRTASLHYTPNNMNHSPKCKLLFLSLSWGHVIEVSLFRCGNRYTFLN